MIKNKKGYANYVIIALLIIAGFFLAIKFNILGSWLGVSEFNKLRDYTNPDCITYKEDYGAIQSGSIKACSSEATLNVGEGVDRVTIDMGLRQQGGMDRGCRTKVKLEVKNFLGFYEDLWTFEYSFPILANAVFVSLPENENKINMKDYQGVYKDVGANDCLITNYYESTGRYDITCVRARTNLDKSYIKDGKIYFRITNTETTCSALRVMEAVEVGNLRIKGSRETVIEPVEPGEETTPGEPETEVPVTTKSIFQKIYDWLDNLYNWIFR